MRRSVFVEAIVALALMWLAACSDPGDIRNVPESLRPKAETVRAALHEQPFQITTEHYEPLSKNLVVLIGESHPSTAAQTQLAAVLSKLSAAGLLDAVLVEGSNGVLDISEFSQRLPKLPGDATFEPFWRRQLERGDIAGYEYFVLTHPSLPAIGIEDMAAKEDFANRALLDEGLSANLHALKRAYESLEAGRNAAAAQGDTSGADEQMTDLKAATATYEKRLAEAMPALKEAAATEAHWRTRYTEAIALEEKLRSPLNEQNEAAKQFNEGRVAYQRSVDRYNGAVQGLNQRTLERDSMWTLIEQQKLLRQKEALETEGSRLRALSDKVASIEAHYATEIARLKTLTRELAGLQKKQQLQHARLEPVLEATSEAAQAGFDAFFRGANSIRTHSGSASAVNAGVAEIAAIDRFFVEERKRAEAANLRDSKRQLHARDSGMAENAAAYASQIDGKVIVVVVGYAHLPGMAEQLANRQMSFISGGLAGNSRNEFWEGPAWKRRGEPYPRVFVPLKSNESLKELSRFLDESWRAEIPAILTHLQKLGPDPVARAMQTIGTDRVMHVGLHLDDHRIPLGEQVIVRGPVGNRSESFEVWDRTASKALVKQLSNKGLQFAYAFQQGSLDGEYRVATPEREASLETFMVTEAAKGTKYVIMFHEPDAIERGGVWISDLWDVMRPVGVGGDGAPPPAAGVASANADDPAPRPKSISGESDTRIATTGEPSAAGGGKGNEPPKVPWYQAGFWDQGGRGDRPGFFRTVNPRRAARNIAALQRQKRLDPREITVLRKVPAVEDVPFTPRDGEAAGLVMIVARNEPEFRAALEQLSDAHKLANKQVALITCGDAFRESAALREMILDGGALMVWMPNRQITEAAGDKLASFLEALREQAAKNGKTFADIDELMIHAVGELRRREALDAEILPLTHSGSFVEVQSEGTSGNQRA